RVSKTEGAIKTVTGRGGRKRAAVVIDDWQRQQAAGRRGRRGDGGDGLHMGAQRRSIG
ncbi:hypothetical protein GW17_00044279, partial [Ensete ventricosum]